MNKLVLENLPIRGLRKISQNWFTQGGKGKLKGLFDLHKLVGTLSYVVTYQKKRQELIIFTQQWILSSTYILQLYSKYFKF